MGEWKVVLFAFLYLWRLSGWRSLHPGAVWRALLDSWSIHVFTDHVVVLQTRAKSRWCCQPGIFWFCGRAGLVGGGPPGRKGEGGNNETPQSHCLHPVGSVLNTASYLHLRLPQSCLCPNSAVVTHDVTVVTPGKLSVVTAERGRWSRHKWARVSWRALGFSVHYFLFIDFGFFLPCSTGWSLQNPSQSKWNVSTQIDSIFKIPGSNDEPPPHYASLCTYPKREYLAIRNPK